MDDHSPHHPHHIADHTQTHVSHDDEQNKGKHEGLLSALSTILLLIAAPIVAILLTLFVFQSYEVDGASMQNTLQNHDRLIVLKLPRTLARITGHAYIPHRYDVIVFNQQESSAISGGAAESKQLIKRVIGLPGERVVVKNGKVTIYNAQHPQGYNPDDSVPETANNKISQGNVDLKVPQGQVFVLGDNRPNSLDSRYFGTVDANNIVGKLVLRIYPFSQAELF